jgi:phage shock protein A
MALLLVAEAAKLVGRDRRTLYKDIQRGRLTATLAATGERQVDTAELLRVYGPFPGAEATATTVVERQQETVQATDQSAEVTRLREQVAALEVRLADKQQHIEHLAQAMRLLEHQPAPEPEQANRRGWWPFWRSKGR